MFKIKTFTNQFIKKIEIFLITSWVVDEPP